MHRFSPAIGFLLFLLEAPLAVAGPGWNQPPENWVEGHAVCITVYSTADKTWLLYNLPQCKMPLSPCSTFKIPNALIGLGSGVLTGPGDLKTWDGTVHDREVLNRDHDLASAISNSVVWYFQNVARDVGAARMQAGLDTFGYGNRDMSGGLDRFWLGSSLQINAIEQVEFLRALAGLELPADVDDQQIVKDLLLQNEGLPADFHGRLYGKTGSCSVPGRDHGWFVGWLERGQDTLVFAVNIIGEGLWGADARRIAVRVLQETQ